MSTPLTPLVDSKSVKLVGGGTLADLGLGQGFDQVNVLKDAINIALDSTRNGALHGIYVHDGWTTSGVEGLPTDLVGMRSEIVFNSTNAIIDILEIKPIPGRHWTRMYDGSAWSAWSLTGCQPNIKCAFGNIGYSWDVVNLFELYAFVTCETLPDGTYKIKGSGTVQNLSLANGALTNYGLNISQIRDLLGIGGSQFIGVPMAKFYRPVNNIYQFIQSFNGMSGTFECYDNGMMRPARYYDGQGHVGGWAVGVWQNGDLIEFEFHFK